MMTRLFRYFLVFGLLLFSLGTVYAQSYKTHKVKKKETLYGIAHDNGLTVEQLKAVNPMMTSPDYKLKKGDIIRIPDPTNFNYDDVRNRAIRLGVALPLNNANNDGQRMIEYYRGVLMACDSLRKEGISVDVRAWNLAENSNVNTVLNDPLAAECDLIIGPFYDKFVNKLANFASKNGIKLVIPYSLHTMDVYTNPNVYQIFQNHEDLNEVTARRFIEWFRDCQPIIIDGGDNASTKGAFTSVLRNQLTQHNVKFKLTSLKTNNLDFASAFSFNKMNVVVLNTANQTALAATFKKLNTMLKSYPNVPVALFGYMEWMPYTDQYLSNFHKFNAYLPAPFYTNLDTPLARRLQTKYRSNFRQEMINILPRFALTGYDHAAFFLRGLHVYGSAFDGSAGKVGAQPAQTPLKFDRIGAGGYQNRSYMFVHYKPDGTIETITY